MDLAHRRQRLELIFEDGALVQWWAHAERKPPRDLGRFEGDGAWLLAAGGDV